MYIPANTIHQPNVASMLVQRRDGGPTLNLRRVDVSCLLECIRSVCDFKLYGTGGGSTNIKISRLELQRAS